MHRLIVIVCVALTFTISGCNDSRSVQASKELTVERFEQIDLALDAAFQHARNYPPRFDSKEQRKNIEKELEIVIAQLETMLADSDSDTEVLFRLGKANTFTYNLDIPESEQNARKYFDSLFSIEKNHTEGHLYYGQHLSGKGDWDEAVKHLEIAANGGQDIALQMIGISYYQQGKKDEAIVYLKRFQKLHPDAPQVNMLLDSLDPSTEDKYKLIKKQN